jgi:hypothetical protein
MSITSSQDMKSFEYYIHRQFSKTCVNYTLNDIE